MWTNNTEIESKIILLDCDVFRHFLKAKMIEKLFETFPGNLYFVEMVYEELIKSPTLRKKVKKYLKDGSIKYLKFPKSKKIRDEYFILERNNIGGHGENSCLAVAKYNKNVVASNNLRDIKQYCITNSILYLTTPDILYYSHAKGIMEESEVDYFLYLNKKALIPSKIPFDTLKEIQNSNPKVSVIFQPKE